MIWLDLANAYGSVPHLLIKLALTKFHVPDKLSDMLMQYFRGVFMRFKTGSYVTDWQALETGTSTSTLYVVGQAIFQAPLTALYHGAL